MSEKWRRVFSPMYAVSTTGRVKNVLRGRKLRPAVMSRGYAQVVLYKNGIRHPRFVHRLVAEAFIGSSPKLQVNHKNGHKLDNSVGNLECVTGHQNRLHALKTGLIPRGENAGRAKLSNADVFQIRKRGKKGRMSAKLAREYGVSAVMICNILRREAWTHI